MQVNHNELRELIKTYYRKRIPLFIKGKIGIGKSDSLRQASQELAKELDLEYVSPEEHNYALNDDTKLQCIDIRLLQMDASDVKGIPSCFIQIKSNGEIISLPILSNQIDRYLKSKENRIIGQEQSFTNNNIFFAAFRQV